MTRSRWRRSRTSPKNSGPTSTNRWSVPKSGRVVHDVAQRLAGEEFTVVAQRRLGHDGGEQQLPHLGQSPDEIIVDAGRLADHPGAERRADDRLTDRFRVEF